MGNHHSSIRTKRNLKCRQTQRSYRHITPKLSTEFEPTKPEEEEEEEEEIQTKFYLPNNDCDIDRQHTHHFIKKILFQSNFSSPIEDKLIQGKSKILDVG